MRNDKARYISVDIKLFPKSRVGHITVNILCKCDVK